jgi:ribosomal protein S18 acetylase RimI-like enzyme
VAISIDALNEDDVDVVQALARSIWFAHYPGIISWAQVHYMLERGYTRDAILAELARGVRWALVRNGIEPIGFCAYRKRDTDVSLDKLYIKAAARRTGAARSCVERASAFARQEGVGSVSLTVNKRNVVAIRAYLAMGFSFAGAVVKDIGDGFVMDDYVMRRVV